MDDGTRLEQMALPQVSRTLSPNERLIAEAITTLLSHYGSSDQHQALRDAQALDWLEDVGEFAAQHVREACKRYRQSPECRRRPMPFDIRSICIDLRDADQRATAIAGAPEQSELRNRHIQMLITFGRWERWWGPYPGVWEIEPVRQQRAKHEGTSP
jgi:hypothetical protein